MSEQYFLVRKLGLGKEVVSLSLVVTKAKANGQMEKITGPPSQCLAQQGSGGSQRPTRICCGDLRMTGVTERHNGPLGLRDDNDDADN